MSSSNISIADVNAVYYIDSIFVQFWGYLLLFLGTVGHILNIYVFTRPKLRSNSCTRYFLASTLAGLVVTYTNDLLRLLQDAYSINFFAYSDASCKILTWIVLWARAQSSWFIALASIDRFLCSSRSVAMRKWSNKRIASRTSLLMLVIVGLFYVYVPIQFKVGNGRTKCPTNQGSYPTFYGYWNLIVFSLGPSTIMLIFGSITIQHMRQSMKRITHQETQIATQNELTPESEQLKRQKIADHHLIRMMLVQCIFFSVMSTPISVSWIYTAARMNITVDTLQAAKDVLFTNVAGILSLTGPCTSFYLFTVSSKLFRGELMNLFSNWPRVNHIGRLNVVQRN